MRYIALFLGLLISTSTFAAMPSKVAGASDFSRKLAGATSWDSLFKVVDGSLNPLVMKELRGLTDGLPYPQMRMKNDRLMISNENGEHLTMVLFEKNGDVSFNGKRWEIQPLAKTETEVKRIADILGSAHASLWDYVVSPAYAGGLSMTMGVAAAAYTSAASWKAEACAKPNPSDELVKTCSLMAVSMEGGADQENTKYVPTDLKCPAKNGGILEFVNRNKAGDAIRMRVFYINDSAQKVVLAVANSSTGRKFEDKLVGPDDTLEQSKKDRLSRAIVQSDNILNKVCLGTAESYEVYMNLLAANTKLTMSSLSPEKDGKESKSNSGL